MTARRPRRSEPQPTDPTGPAAAAPATIDPPRNAAEVIRSEERLHVHTERIPVERIRVRKRIVTETRTLTVQVRREELQIERLPATGDHPTGATAAQGEPSAPVVDLVLAEEVPQVTLHAAPRERVRIYRDTPRSSQSVQATLRREHVEVTNEPPPAA